MNSKQSGVNGKLYLINFALLFTHEIDSAFWKEWELFGIPGEIQVFLVLNFALLIVALYGFQQVILGTPRALAFSILLAASGIFAFCIHTFFIATGHSQFTLPVSLITLAAALIVSIAQFIFAIQTLRTH